MSADLQLAFAKLYPELFEVRAVDGLVTVLVRPEAEGKPCPCCGKPLAGSPLPRSHRAAS